ncbi:MAG TPA: hypothetical protein EYP87_07790 [Flavobacteriaceae bacterium]|nr:hypothetical protein [Flavobacteriaceae bacterium]
MKIITTTQQIIIVLIFMLTSFTQAQKLQKIKGSKVVTLTEIALDSVTSIELYKNIDLVLKNGETDKLTIYADDNLHDVVDVDLNGGKLSLSLLKRITRKKKFELTLYVRNLSLIILDDDSTIINNDFYKTENLNIVLNNNSEFECFIEAESIVLESNDSSDANFTFKAENIEYTLQDRSDAKGTSNAEVTKITLDGRTSIDLNGKSDETIIDIKDSSRAKLTNLLSKLTEIVAKDKTSIYTNTTEDLTIKVKGSSKIYIYGKAEIDLIEFKNKAILYKK